MKLNKILYSVVTSVLMASLLNASAGLAQEKVRKKKKVSKTTEGGSASSSGSYQAPYGMAGCGLGSLMFKSNTSGAQSTAVTSNGTGGQTFAITSGTSNCVDTPAETAAVEREVYISANLSSLSKEVAQGEGMHLRAFADVLGCANEDTLPVFADLSRSNHGRIFNSEEPRVVLQNYLGVLKANKELAQSCARLGA